MSAQEGILANRYEKLEENIRSYYDRQLSELETGSSDVVYQKEGADSSTAETRTIVREDDQFVLERIPRLVTELEDILLRVLNLGDRHNSSELDKSVPDCKDIFSRTTSEIVNDEAFHRGLVNGGSAKKDRHSTIYVKGLTEVLRGYFKVCGKEDIMFRPEHRKALSRIVSPSMGTH